MKNICVFIWKIEIFFVYLQRDLKHKILLNLKK